MSWEDLAVYIKQQLEQGYSLDYLRNYLYSLNYPASDIEKAINYVYVLELSDYIQSRLNQGVPLSQLKYELSKQGYSAEIINRAVSNVYHSPLSRDVGFFFKYKTLSFILLGIILIGGILVLSIFMAKTHNSQTPLQPLQMDISINALSKTIIKGEPVRISVDLTNFGSTSRYDVHVRYELINKETQQSILLGDEVVAIETQRSFIKELSLPDHIQEGEYELRASVTYGQINDFSSTSIFIKKPQQKSLPTINKTKPQQLKNKTRPAPGPHVTQIQTNNLNMIEILNNIEDIAKSDKTKAVQLCSQINYEIYKNDCFAKTARAIKDAQVCQLITSRVIRDNCYASIEPEEVSGKASICGDIEDITRKDLCLVDVAVRSGSMELCNQINNTNLRNSCTMQIKQAELMKKLNISYINT